MNRVVSRSAFGRAYSLVCFLSLATICFLPSCSEQENVVAAKPTINLSQQTSLTPHESISFQIETEHLTALYFTLDNSEPQIPADGISTKEYTKPFRLSDEIGRSLSDGETITIKVTALYDDNQQTTNSWSFKVSLSDSGNDDSGNDDNGNDNDDNDNDDNDNDNDNDSDDSGNDDNDNNDNDDEKLAINNLKIVHSEETWGDVAISFDRPEQQNLEVCIRNFGTVNDCDGASSIGTWQPLPKQFPLMHSLSIGSPGPKKVSVWIKNQSDSTAGTSETIRLTPAVMSFGPTSVPSPHGDVDVDISIQVRPKLPFPLSFRIRAVESDAEEGTSFIIPKDAITLEPNQDTMTIPIQVRSFPKPGTSEVVRLRISNTGSRVVYDNNILEYPPSNAPAVPTAIAPLKATIGPQDAFSIDVKTDKPISVSYWLIYDEPPRGETIRPGWNEQYKGEPILFTKAIKRPLINGESITIVAFIGIEGLLTSSLQQTYTVVVP